MAQEPPTQAAAEPEPAGEMKPLAQGVQAAAPALAQVPAAHLTHEAAVALPPALKYPARQR